MGRSTFASAHVVKALSPLPNCKSDHGSRPERIDTDVNQGFCIDYWEDVRRRKTFRDVYSKNDPALWWYRARHLWLLSEVIPIALFTLFTSKACMLITFILLMDSPLVMCRRLWQSRTDTNRDPKKSCNLVTI
ncbi:hypothetical protein AcV5_002078 [Taiwanofungus camphoratus]|nr:hypothetical protein AcV5_002078 [Antrodia cinnamomea]